MSNKTNIETKIKEKESSIQGCEPTLPISHDAYQKLLSLKKENEATIQKNITKIAELDILMKHPVHNIRAKHDSTEDNLKELSISGEPYIAELESKLSEPFVGGEPEELDEKLEKLQQKLSFISWKASLDQFTSKLKNKFVDFQTPAIAFLTKKQEENDAKINSIQSEILSKSELLSDMVRSLKTQSCPECGTSLTINGDKIVKDTDKKIFTQDQINELKIEIDKLKTKNKEYNDKTRDITSLLVEAKHLKETAVKDPMPEISSKDEIESQRKEIKEQKAKIEKEKQDRAAISQRIKEYYNNIKALESQLKSLDDKCKGFSDIPLYYNINDQKETLIKANSEISARQTLIWCDISSYLKYESAKKVYDEKISQICELKEDLLKIESQVATLEKEIKTATNRWAGAVRLKDISDSAAIGATEGIIAAINGYAEDHINELFPHGGTSVKILSGTKTNKGEDRAKLALSVVHKGQNVGKSISPLSGGEQDRIKVAFQLSLAEIYNAQFLMLDEPFAGVDVEMTMEICLGLLKRFASNRLVLMAQHGAPEGLFDSVLEI